MRLGCPCDVARCGRAGKGCLARYLTSEGEQCCTWAEKGGIDAAAVGILGLLMERPTTWLTGSLPFLVWHDAARGRPTLLGIVCRPCDTSIERLLECWGAGPDIGRQGVVGRDLTGSTG